ncbi:MAG: hypothetical protein V4507_10765 [Verrucomicrobiota bacterium]
MANDTETKSAQLKLIPEVWNKFQAACDELKQINTALKFEPKSLMELTLETVDYDELIENMILFEDRRLKSKIEELKKARKGFAVRSKDKKTDGGE